MRARAQAPSPWTSRIRVVRPVTLHGPVIVTQSSRPALRLTLGAARSIGLDKGMAACVQTLRRQTE